MGHPAQLSAPEWKPLVSVRPGKLDILGCFPDGPRGGLIHVFGGFLFGLYSPEEISDHASS